MSSSKGSLSLFFFFEIIFGDPFLTDPCLEEPQQCLNVVGSYVCGCKEGYTPIGNTTTCIDVDECVQGTHSCTKGETCKVWATIDFQ